MEGEKISREGDEVRLGEDKKSAREASMGPIMGEEKMSRGRK